MITGKTELIPALSPDAMVSGQHAIPGKIELYAMKERKYKEDWINETRIDEKGKEKRVPVYRGEMFTFPSGRNKQQLLLSALLPWIGYLALLILYFMLDFPGGRVLYVFLPAALGLFPCLYWAMGIWGLFCAPREMTRVQKETGISRILRSAAGCAVFSCASLAGEAVFLLTGGDAAREWPGLLMLAACAALAVLTVSFFRNVHNQISEKRSGES